MIREIKFRGKRKDNGKWVYGDLHQLNDGSCFMGIHDETWSDDGFHSDFYDHVEEIKEETIGQFTGLKDKNGKEIYEGDIMLFHCREYFAVWDEEEARFVFTNKTNNRLTPYKSTSEECFVVIGNIYDDRRLLKNDASA